MADDEISMKEFGASFKDFMDKMSRQAPQETPYFLDRIRRHFGAEPASLPTVIERFELFDHPNVQVALDACLAGPGRTFELLGLHMEHSYMGLSLSQFVAAPGSGLLGSPPVPGPVSYVNVPLFDETMLPCIKQGLFLARDQQGSLAALVQCADDSYNEKLQIEVMASTRPAAEAFLAELRQAMRRNNVYRGHVISLGVAPHGHAVTISFERLPPVGRDGIILPAGLLELIERETIGFARHSRRLRAAGRHLRRGILLHGPPGTGKTLTAMYLAGQMSDHTTIQLTGRSLALIERSCTLARLLQPAIVILEDVDLVAEERTRQQGCATPILFELLNEMDGLADDAQILFLLTTNRPDLLEPALAARPGRIDQAIQVPLPDADCRRRLVELYSRGLVLELEDPEAVIARTEKASAAFMRELLRKAALLSADASLTAAGATTTPERPAADDSPQDIVIRDEHVDQAIRDLVSGGCALTRSMLGFKID